MLCAVEAMGILGANLNNAAKLGKAACDLVVTVLRTYISHAEVIKFACKCLKLLAEVDANLVTFSGNDSCGAITAILEKYGAMNEMIAEWGCKSIFVLARKSVRNQKQLGMKTCELLVVNILKSEVKSPTFTINRHLRSL